MSVFDESTRELLLLFPQVILKACSLFNRVPTSIGLLHVLNTSLTFATLSHEYMPTANLHYSLRGNIQGPWMYMWIPKEHGFLRLPIRNQV